MMIRATSVLTLVAVLATGCSTPTIQPSPVAIAPVQVWDGFAGGRWGPPPGGAVTVIGTFDGYWRGDEEFPDGKMSDLEVTLDTWVVDGADETRLSPPEIADAALADTAFAAYLETQEVGNGREVVMWYRPSRSLWEVGLLVWNEPPGPKMHLVLVDPNSGAIVDTVDRPWDEQLDGFP